MKKYILRIRREDRRVLESIEKGQKTIETRAATPRYLKISSGDMLVFICGSDRVERIVASVRHFRAVNELLGAVDFRMIIPTANSIDEVKEILLSFPGNKEKIEKSGIIAFGLGKLA